MAMPVPEAVVAALFAAVVGFVGLQILIEGVGRLWQAETTDVWAPAAIAVTIISISG